MFACAGTDADIHPPPPQLHQVGPMQEVQESTPLLIPAMNRTYHGSLCLSPCFPLILQYINHAPALVSSAINPAVSNILIT